MLRITRRNISLLQRAIMFVRQTTLVPNTNNNFFSGINGTLIIPTLTMAQVRRNMYGERIRGASHGAGVSRPGDWICVKCGYNNFSYRSRCNNCDNKPENREVAEGDWICPNCEFYNFRSRTVCFKCDTPSPNMDRNEDSLT